MSLHVLSNCYADNNECKKGKRYLTIFFATKILKPRKSLWWIGDKQRKDRLSMTYFVWKSFMLTLQSFFNNAIMKPCFIVDLMDNISLLPISKLLLVKCFVVAASVNCMLLRCILNVKTKNCVANVAQTETIL